MTVIPKDIDDPDTWALFERYESINKYHATTERLTLVFFAVVLLAVGVNLGSVDSAKITFTGLEVQLHVATPLSVLLLLTNITLAKVIATRLRLLQHYSGNLIDYFVEQTDNAYARRSKHFVEWRLEMRPEVTVLEDAWHRWWHRSLWLLVLANAASLLPLLLSDVLPAASLEIWKAD